MAFGGHGRFLRSPQEGMLRMERTSRARPRGSCCPARLWCPQ